MLRFGNPYTRDISAAARNQRDAARAIAQTGRTAGVANLNGNRDMSRRVVTATEIACPCPVLPRPVPLPPPPAVCQPVGPVWACYAPSATPTWSCTDESGGVIVCGYIDAGAVGEFYDSSGVLQRTFADGVGPTGFQKGFVISYSATGSVNWLVTMRCGFSGIQPLKIVSDELGNVYFMAYTQTTGTTSMTLTSNDGSNISSPGIQNRNTIYIGKIDSIGQALWISIVTSDFLNSIPVVLEALDLAVTSDNRLVLLGKASTPASSRYARFFDAAGVFVTAFSVSSVRPYLFLFSVNSAGISGKVAKIQPVTSGSLTGVNLLENETVIVVTGYSMGHGNLQILDSSITSVVITQNSGVQQGFVIQFQSDLTFEWVTKVVGSLYPINTTVSTSSSFAGVYQRGILWNGTNYFYTGQFGDVSSGITFVDSGGGSSVSLPQSSSFSTYVGILDGSDGLHTGAIRITTAEGVAPILVLSSVADSSSGDFYLLCQVSLTGLIPSETVLFYNASGGSAAGSLPLSFVDGTFRYNIVVKYSGTGVFQWVRAIGGVNDAFYGTVTGSSQGCPMVYGPFSGSVLRIYDESGAVIGTLTNSGGGRDGYFAKWSTDGEFVGVGGLLTTANDANIWISADLEGGAYTLTDNRDSLVLQDMAGSNVFTVPTRMTISRWMSL